MQTLLDRMSSRDVPGQAPTAPQQRVLAVGRRHGPPTSGGDVNVKVVVKAFSGKQAREELMRKLRVGVTLSRTVKDMNAPGSLTVDAKSQNVCFTASGDQPGGIESLPISKLSEVKENAQDACRFSLLVGSVGKKAADQTLDLVCADATSCSSLVDGFRHLMK